MRSLMKMVVGSAAIAALAGSYLEGVGERSLFATVPQGILAKARGQERDFGSGPWDVCAEASLSGNQISKMRCEWGGSPGAECIDCGTQSDLVTQVNGYTHYVNGPEGDCSINLKIVGECEWDASFNYFCNHAEPSMNEGQCSGTVPMTGPQGMPPGG